MSAEVAGGVDVTVVVAAHQAAGTIGQALASVAAQTVEPAEVVVVDDCSADATVDAASRWDGVLPLRIVRRAANGGPAAARHDGVRTARTALVALLDADDIWLPDHLATLVELHRSHGDFVSADAHRWMPGEPLGPTFGSTHPVPPPDLQPLALLQRNFVFIGALFGRDLYERVGGFRDRFRGPEDWDLWIRMVRAGARVVRPTHATVLYRCTTGSLSNQDRQVDEDIAVLGAAVEEAPSTRERWAARRSLVHARGQRSLYLAYADAERGRGWQARLRALGGVRGTRRVVVRSAAMVLTPSWTARRRRAVMADPGWWMTR